MNKSIYAQEIINSMINDGVTIFCLASDATTDYVRASERFLPVLCYGEDEEEHKLFGNILPLKSLFKSEVGSISGMRFIESDKINHDIVYAAVIPHVPLRRCEINGEAYLKRYIKRNGKVFSSEAFMRGLKMSDTY